MDIIVRIAVIILFMFVVVLCNYLSTAIEKINEFNKKIKDIEQDITTLKFRTKIK